MPAYKYIRDIVITDKELIKTTTQKTKRAEEIKTVLQDYQNSQELNIRPNYFACNENVIFL